MVRQGDRGGKRARFESFETRELPCLGVAHAVQQFKRDYTPKPIPDRMLSYEHDPCENGHGRSLCVFAFPKDIPKVCCCSNRVRCTRLSTQGNSSCNLCRRLPGCCLWMLASPMSLHMLGECAGRTSATRASLRTGVDSMTPLLDAR